MTDRNDLGIHTEMFSDGVIRLVKEGVITGERKTLHQGKIVGSFAAGTQELFDFLDNNPMIEMHPSEYTNDPRVIAQHDNIVAINSAIEVDLTGQAVADSIGERLYSGIGGHADFMRGAAMARGGKPVLALPSTAKTKDGLRSRIVPFIQLGAGVVTTRGDVHYVVTEYGVAYLHGKTMRERAMALIAIAHPDFRAELLHAAKRRHLVYADQILPAAHPYPAQLETTYTTNERPAAADPADQALRRGLDQGHVLLVQRTDQVPALPRHAEGHAAQQGAGLLQRRLRHRDGAGRGAGRQGRTRRDRGGRTLHDQSGQASRRDGLRRRRRLQRKGSAPTCSTAWSRSASRKASTSSTPTCCRRTPAC